MSLPRNSSEEPLVPGIPKVWAASPGYELSKRAIDLVLAAVMALVLLPVMAALAVAVMFSFRTWRPIFVHERVGCLGRRLRTPKLRSLPLGARPDADKYAVAAMGTTRLGQFLRSSHLDELPQLFLVVVGRMSLVGPRPEMPILASQFDPDFAVARSGVRPGCTGLWQVSSDADKLINEVPHYDTYYLRARSLRLDCWILWRTILMLVRGVRVVFPGDIPQWTRPRARSRRVADPPPPCLVNGRFNLTEPSAPGFPLPRWRVVPKQGQER